MDLVDRVVKSHLERANLDLSREAKAREVERGEEINALPLKEFQDLPREDRVFAEELWTARMLEVNQKLERRRLARQGRELDLAES